MTTTITKAVTPMAKKNPRRLIVRTTRDAIAAARGIVSRWNVPASDYDWDGPRDEAGSVRRIARRPEDFPENQVEAWQRLSRDARALARIFTTIQGFADQKAVDLIEATTPIRGTRSCTLTVAHDPHVLNIFTSTAAGRWQCPGIETGAAS